MLITSPASVLFHYIVKREKPAVYCAVKSHAKCEVIFPEDNANHTVEDIEKILKRLLKD